MTLELVTDSPTLTASQVLTASGISYRQLDFWVRAGYLKPSTPARGYGSVRRFPATEAEIAAYALELITAGFTASAALDYARRLVETQAPITLAAGLIEIGRRL
jgi:DNA-binding transcriptional MerR regulator